MYDDQILKRHRLSALANGVLVGMGIIFLLFGSYIGAVSIIAGVGLEVWHRKRISRGLTDVWFSLAGGGIIFLLFGGYIGLVSIIAGVGLEVWHRKRISKAGE